MEETILNRLIGGIIKIVISQSLIVKDKKEIQSVKAHLCSIFSGFVKIGDWYLKMSEVKEYKPVTAEDMNPYILFKTSKFGNIKVRFPKDEDMNAELLVLDQLFDVE